MAKYSSHILDMARKGAEHRYEELNAEITSLIRHFPHLGGAARKGAKGAATTPPRRRRKPMSAASKKAVSERMKKYWAKRRHAKS